MRRRPCPAAADDGARRQRCTAREGEGGEVDEHQELTTIALEGTARAVVAGRRPDGAWTAAARAEETGTVRSIGASPHRFRAPEGGGRRRRARGGASWLRGGRNRQRGAAAGGGLGGGGAD